jgi:hypothetical protein
MLETVFTVEAWAIDAETRHPVEKVDFIRPSPSASINIFTAPPHGTYWFADPDRYEFLLHPMTLNGVYIKLQEAGYAVRLASHTEWQAVPDNVAQAQQRQEDEERRH